MPVTGFVAQPARQGGSRRPQENQSGERIQRHDEPLSKAEGEANPAVERATRLGAGVRSSEFTLVGCGPR